MPLQEEEFDQWLDSFVQTFKELKDEQKTRTLKAVLELCSCEQLTYLTQVFIPGSCQIDFLSHLPNDVVIKILKYLDGKSLKKCRKVCKSWNKTINSSKEVWLHQFWKLGGQVLAPSSITGKEARKLYWHQYQYKEKFNEDLDKAQFVFGPYDDEDNDEYYKLKSTYFYKPYLAAGSEDRSVYFWDTTTGIAYLVKVIEAHSICQIKFDKEFLYTASYDNTAACWNLESGQQHSRFVGHVNAVMCIEPIRSLKIVLTGSADSTIKIWDHDSGELLQTLVKFHSGWIKQVRALNSPLPDHLVILSCDTKGQICVWSKFFDQDRTLSHEHRMLLNVPFCLSSPIVTNNGLVCIPADISQVDVNNSTVNIIQSGRGVLSFFSVTAERRNGNETLVCSCVQKVPLPSSLSESRTLIGAGRRFAVFHVTEDYISEEGDLYPSSLCIVDLELKEIYQTSPVFHESPFGEPPILGETDWLDGFNERNHPWQLLITQMGDCHLSLTTGTK
ncbi:F-box/WD repeat-containing protein 2-like [Saccostrea cucullata]|uniref:F-box/WD repeat-containing protein 2-like n=1 Tax=Saccostrea cuccullata TaxID=36930 RepID=UPI002ED4ED2D